MYVSIKNNRIVINSILGVNEWFDWNFGRKQNIIEIDSIANTVLNLWSQYSILALAAFFKLREMLLLLGFFYVKLKLL